MMASEHDPVVRLGVDDAEMDVAAGDTDVGGVRNVADADVLTHGLGVVGGDADDLAEPERDDGEVIAP